jgi:hypothetical protein
MHGHPEPASIVAKRVCTTMPHLATQWPLTVLI